MRAQRTPSQEVFAPQLADRGECQDRRESHAKIAESGRTIWALHLSDLRVSFRALRSLDSCKSVFSVTSVIGPL
jgi:hypothetical protein